MASSLLAKSSEALIPGTIPLPGAVIAALYSVSKWRIGAGRSPSGQRVVAYVKHAADLELAATKSMIFRFS